MRAYGALMLFGGLASTAMAVVLMSVYPTGPETPWWVNIWIIWGLLGGPPQALGGLHTLRVSSPTARLQNTNRELLDYERQLETALIGADPDDPTTAVNEAYLSEVRHTRERIAAEMHEKILEGARRGMRRIG